MLVRLACSLISVDYSTLFSLILLACSFNFQSVFLKCEVFVAAYVGLSTSFSIGGRRYSVFPICFQSRILTCVSLFFFPELSCRCFNLSWCHMRVSHPGRMVAAVLRGGVRPRGLRASAIGDGCRHGGSVHGACVALLIVSSFVCVCACVCFSSCCYLFSSSISDQFLMNVALFEGSQSRFQVSAHILIFGCGCFALFSAYSERHAVILTRYFSHYVFVNCMFAGRTHSAAHGRGLWPIRVRASSAGGRRGQGGGGRGVRPLLSLVLVRRTRTDCCPFVFSLFILRVFLSSRVMRAPV